MSDRERPKLKFEQALDRTDSGKREAFNALPIPPHCDPRILHHKNDECEFCSEAKELQDEREQLGISNTGHANRKYPCPADEARSKANYNAWPGNRPTTRLQIEENCKKLVEELKDIMNAKRAQCCVRDHNYDGNCDIHSAPGVLRIG